MKQDEPVLNFKGKIITEKGFNEAFGLTLKRLRGKYDYKPLSANQETGLDRKFLYDLEDGSKGASLFTLFRIASGTEATPTDIVHELENILEEVL